MTKSRVVHVDIGGQRYAIRTELDPQYVAEVAAYVDAKIEMAGRELSTTDALRVTVIAALNLADELYRARDESAGAADRIGARFAVIERLVDDAISGVRMRAVNE
jgi:cell division protein ZapA